LSTLLQRNEFNPYGMVRSEYTLVTIFMSIRDFDG
jgi:hypothetical protein